MALSTLEQCLYVENGQPITLVKISFILAMVLVACAGTFTNLGQRALRLFFAATQLLEATGSLSVVKNSSVENGFWVMPE
ncbi:MAG: hypothetical protein QE263_04825 [Vampirovibrionales bacterium]|nr:hypothetical protein [Vampirovibrionales bacterium]